MAWEKKAGKVITKQKATDMIERYQKEHKDATRSVYYDVDILRQLIDTKGAAGVSIFFAKNDEGRNTVVLYPVDANGKIIYENESTALKTASTDSLEAASNTTTGTGVNVGSPCPPYCPVP